jgi:hypothetical protein
MYVRFLVIGINYRLIDILACSKLFFSIYLGYISEILARLLLYYQYKYSAVMFNNQIIVFDEILH